MIKRTESIGWRFLTNQRVGTHHVVCCRHGTGLSRVGEIFLIEPRV